MRAIICQLKPCVTLHSEELLDSEPLFHQPLQPRFVENIEGKFFVGKHSQCRPFGACDQFGSFFHRQVGILSEDRPYHADHHLQASDLFSFLLFFTQITILPHPVRIFHTAPDRSLLRASRGRARRTGQHANRLTPVVLIVTAAVPESNSPGSAKAGHTNEPSGGNRSARHACPIAYWLTQNTPNP